MGVYRERGEWEQKQGQSGPRATARAKNEGQSRSSTVKARLACNGGGGAQQCTKGPKNMSKAGGCGAGRLRIAATAVAGRELGGGRTASRRLPAREGQPLHGGSGCRAARVSAARCRARCRCRWQPPLAVAAP